MSEESRVIEKTEDELYENFEKRVNDGFDKKLSEFSKSVFEQPEFKELLKSQKEGILADLEDKGKKEVHPYSRAAEFVRVNAMGVLSKDFTEINKIQKEEADRYIAYHELKGKALTTFMTETSNVQGGYLMPIDWYNRLFEIPQAFGIARRDCLVIPMSTYLMKINNLTIRPRTYWIAPQVDLEYRAKDVTKPKFGQIELKPAQQVAIIVWEEELFADATPNLVQNMTRWMATSMARGEDDALFNGNGGAGITGLLNDATIQVITMGAGDVGFANIDFNDLLDMIDAVDALGGGINGKFYFHPNMLTHLRKITDLQNQYIWSPPTVNAPGTLWGKPYETSCVMPSNAASNPSTKFIIYGDLKESVAFGDRQRLTVKMLSEATIDGTNLAENNLLAMRWNERLDIEVVLGDTIAVLRTHT